MVSNSSSNTSFQKSFVSGSVKSIHSSPNRSSFSQINSPGRRHSQTFALTGILFRKKARCKTGERNFFFEKDKTEPQSSERFRLRTSTFLSVILSMLDHLFGMFVNKFPEIFLSCLIFFEGGVVFVKESNHGVWKTDGQITLKNNTIKTIDTFLDVVREKLYKGG